MTNILEVPWSWGRSKMQCSAFLKGPKIRYANLFYRIRLALSFTKKLVEILLNCLIFQIGFTDWSDF